MRINVIAGIGSLIFIFTVTNSGEMGLTYASVELINRDDMALAQRYVIGEEEIKRMHVEMLVDTGAYMLAINESIQE